MDGKIRRRRQAGQEEEIKVLQKKLSHFIKRIPLALETKESSIDTTSLEDREGAMSHRDFKNLE